MVSKKLDTLDLVLQPFILGILVALTKGPKRFAEFKTAVRNEKTLSLKLSKLQDVDLITVKHKKTKNGYANFYSLTTHGRTVVKAVERLRKVSK